MPAGTGMKGANDSEADSKEGPAFPPLCPWAMLRFGCTVVADLGRSEIAKACSILRLKAALENWNTARRWLNT